MAVSSTSLTDITCDRCGAVEVVPVTRRPDGRREDTWMPQADRDPPPPPGWVRVQWPSGRGLMIDLCGQCAGGITLTMIAGMDPGRDMHDVEVITGRQRITPPQVAAPGIMPVPPWLGE